MAAYASTRDPLDIQRKGEEFEGAPAFQLYIRGAEELAYQLKNNPVVVKAVKFEAGTEHTNTDVLSKRRKRNHARLIRGDESRAGRSAGEQAMAWKKE